MHVSIEVPVFKGDFLRPCIDSVLAQTSDAWTLSLLWDGGDRHARAILEEVRRDGDPRVSVYFGENRGVAGARRFLTEHSDGDYILPLDDDDVLPPVAVGRLLEVAAERPWASLIRGRREFIDTDGAVVKREPWFPFAPRTYHRGMVTDLFNQAQPYLIRRSAYLRTEGWTGFPDFMGAGEDCDIFLRLEAVAHFELVDEVLYHYRLHGRRASDALTSAAAFEMWRRLADGTIERLGLPLRRVSDVPPFVYEDVPRPAATPEDVDFVVRGRGGVSAQSLRRCGVAEGAIHPTDGAPNPEAWKMDGFRSTARRLVCFVDGRVAFHGGTWLEALLGALETTGADLVAPRLSGEGGAALVLRECLLVKREVISATGGFDESYVPTSLQDVDLCIQARRRGFRCAAVPVAGVTYRGRPERNWTAADVARLRSKWRSHPALLEPSAESGQPDLPS